MNIIGPTVMFIQFLPILHLIYQFHSKKNGFKGVYIILGGFSFPKIENYIGFRFPPLP